MFGYVYKTVNKVNGKIYVGKKHSSVYVEDYYGSGKLILRAIRKYGIENFTNEVIEFYPSLKELNEGEKYWIKELDSQYKSGKGYNISFGGDGGDLVINMLPHEYEQFVEDCRKRSIGDKNPNYGNGDKIRGDKNPSKRPEVRARLRETSGGKNNGMYGVRGEKHPRFGKKATEEERKKISEGVIRAQKEYSYVCKRCNESFVSKSATAKFCSKRCKSKFHNKKNWEKQKNKNK